MTSSERQCRSRLSFAAPGVDNMNLNCLKCNNIWEIKLIKPHIDYASVVWDGCGEVYFKKLNSLHRRAGKLILPDPSLSTEQKVSAFGILNLTQQLAYNKRIFIH